MKTNKKVSEIIRKYKEEKKAEKAEEAAKEKKPIRIDIDYSKPYKERALPFKERDMRQEAIDLGSHNAIDYFGGPSDAGE